MGSQFSWSNNQLGDARVFPKLDWVFYSENWSDDYNTYFTLYHSFPDSDHCYLLLKSISMEDSGIRLFRFFNIWCEHP